MDDTISEGWRDIGNMSYKHFLESNNAKCQRNYLHSALNAYLRAYETAETSNDKSSAAKNYGTAAWRLSNVLIQLNEKATLCEFRFCEAVSYFSKAAMLGEQKNAEWKHKLEKSFQACIGESIELASSLLYQNRIQMLEKCLGAMCEDSQKPVLFLEIATVLCHAGISAVNTKDFMTALHAFHDCYRPVQEIRRLTCQTGDIYREACVIESDVAFHMATASALQAIKAGDDSLESALNDDETLCMDKVYDALDRYRLAVIETREIEVEMEAVAMSRLGSVYDKVLKWKSRAKDYFNVCMQLAVSMQPRNFTGESWYQTCTEALQHYQSESVMNDAAVWQRERENHIKDLKAELKDIWDADRGSGVEGIRCLLRHLYKTYPPKNPDHKLSEKDLTEKPKKVLMSAILHYHPDKQDKEKHGGKWFVLCEEITKVLNGRHECSKSMD